VIESLTTMRQTHRELRTDSGGAGRFRGGLGQATEMTCDSGPGSVSGMVDRIQYAGSGLEGGRPGATGRLLVNDEPRAKPKSLVTLEPGERVTLDLPGGGGYGDPLTRDPERVLSDVVEGYVSLEAAEREYGVAIAYLGRPDQLVRLPRHFAIDREKTARLRAAHG